MERAPLPLTIGPANCEAVCGLPWRHLRDHASELGLRFVGVGRKRVLLASEVLAALESLRTSAAAPERLAIDPAAQVRDLLGVKLRRVG